MQKLNWKKLDRQAGKVFAVLVIAVIVFLCVRHVVLLNGSTKYTIGIAIDTRYNARLLEKLEYTYEVNHVTYTRSKNHNYEVIGKRYYVKYSTKDPNISELLDDKPVPESIKEAPPEGWGKIPENEQE